MSPFTKAFRLPLYGFIRKFKSNEKIQLIIPNSVKSDLAVWSNVIQYSKKGLPIAPRPSLPPIYAIRCTSDAAGVDLTLSPNETEGKGLEQLQFYTLVITSQYLSPESSGRPTSFSMQKITKEQE